ncbi:MAG: TIGR01459 family HAD-type hydrolase [Alphaproteobacteria bacterium]|nr:MAG: TIGR01459 family HAD-type hydrolase [Alphaproteobacteria bacterium]
MSSVALLSGLSKVASEYDAIFCDVWGVIHNGREAFAEACVALKKFRETRGSVVLITNAPVPKDRVTRLFPKFGVPMDCFDDVIASGDATRNELKRVAPGPVYRIGLDEDFGTYAGLPLEFSDDPDVAKVVCCTSLREYPDGKPEPYRDELKRLAAKGLPMICANPDVVFRQGDKLIWSAGSLAKIYIEEGGQVISPGKPDEPIYRLAFERAAELAGREIAPGRVLAIGDGPATDVLGANRQGIDALFIGGGIHGHAMESGEGFLASATKILAADGVSAKWAMPELGW